MGGLMSAARAAQAATAGQTIMGGAYDAPVQTARYQDEPAPVKTAYAEETTPTRPVFNEGQVLPDDPEPVTRGDQRNAPLQEEYRAKKESALPPGPIDRRLAAYKEQSGMRSDNAEGSERPSPFARFGSDTEENPLRAQNEAAPKQAKQQLALNDGAKADSYGKYETPSGSGKAPGFGHQNKPQDAGVDPASRVAQNTQASQISDVTTDGFKKHRGEIWIEKNWPKVNAIIEREAKAAGVNPRWLKIIAYLESSGNPLKENGRYIGLFQFDPNDSWKKYGEGGDIRDATASTRAMIRAMKDYDKTFNRETFRKEFRLPTLPELFLIHNQGPTGSRALRMNPDEIAWKALVRAGMSEAKAKEHIGQNVSDTRANNLDRLTSRQVLEYKFAGGEGYGNWFIPKSYDVTIDKDGVAKDLSPWWPAQGPGQNKTAFAELSGEEARRLSIMRDTISTYLQAPRRTSKLPKWPDR